MTAAKSGTPGARGAQLSDLRDRIRGIEGRAAQDRERRRERLGLDPTGAVRTGWDSVDGTLGGEQIGGQVTPDGLAHRGLAHRGLAHRGLARGRLHEWCGVESGATWAPPLTLLSHLAHRTQTGHVLWIGRRVWPLLHRDHALLARSLFVDPPDRARLLWAVDCALRCPAVGAVIADGTGLRIEESRRLQLAAESSDALALLTRPFDERAELSVATTRWSLARTPNDENGRPRWRLALLRVRGESARPTPPFAQWTLEWNDATGALVELPPLVHRPREASPAPLAGLGSA